MPAGPRPYGQGMTNPRVPGAAPERVTPGTFSLRLLVVLGLLLLLAGASSAVRVVVATVPGSPAEPETRAARPSPVSGPLPACDQADEPATHPLPRQWASTLLDTHFSVAPDYEPPNLVSTARAGLGDGHRVRRLVIADLRAMTADAGRAGVTLEVTSGYRNYDDQAALYRDFTRLLGPEDGARRAARPGHSEHQLGTALDFADTPGAHTWLAGNGWRFGFVVSYPSGAGAESCYQDEPWHLRYFGRARAAAIQRSGLVPRAWLWDHMVRADG